MTLQEVIANIDNTIKGKELLLAKLKERHAPIAMTGEAEHLINELVLETSIRFVNINLIELQAIRADLEKISG